MLESLDMDGVPLLAPGFIDNWIKPEVQGLDSPLYRDVFDERAGEDGAFVPTQQYGGRVVALPGTLAADDMATFAVRRRALIALCAIKRDADTNPIAKRFTGTTLDGLGIYFDGHVRRPIFGNETPTSCSFMIPVICADQNIYLSQAVSSGQVGVLSSGGAHYPVTYPVNYGTVTGGTVAVTHPGTADTWPVITLRGPLSNPKLYHAGRGVTFALNYSLGASDVAVINMKQKIAVLNGTSSLLAYRTLDSDWFSLMPGNNPITLTTDSSGDTGTVEVGLNPGLLGI